MKIIYLLLSYFIFFSTNIGWALTEWEEFAFDSVRNGDVFKLENCLDHQVPWDVVSGPIEKGLIYVAVETNKREVLNFLLKMGFDPNLKNKVWDTPLLLATKLGFNLMAKDLLQNNADPNITNFFGESPLLVAIEKRNSDLALLLLSYGASPTFRNINNGMTPLKMASKLGLEDVVMALLQKKEIDENSRKEAIEIATEEGNYDIVLLLNGDKKVKKRSFLQKIFGRS